MLRCDMVVGQDQPVGGEDDAQPQIGLAAYLSLQRHNAGYHLGGDLFDGGDREIDPPTASENFELTSGCR